MGAVSSRLRPHFSQVAKRWWEKPSWSFPIASLVWAAWFGAVKERRLLANPIPSHPLSYHCIVPSCLLNTCMYIVYTIYILYIYYNIHDIRTNPQIGGQDPRVLVTTGGHPSSCHHICLWISVVLLRNIFMLVSQSHDFIAKSTPSQVATYSDGHELDLDHHLGKTNMFYTM